MTTATFKYKCRLCETIFGNLATAPQNARNWLFEVLQAGYSDCNGSIPLTSTAMHECPDGAVGVADIVGYTLTEDA